MTAGVKTERAAARVVCIQDGEDRDGVLAGLRGEPHILAERAASTAEALERFGHERIDLVVLDLTHSQVPVAEIIRELRDHSATRAAGILAITEEDQRPRALAGLERGADAYLVRPVDPHGLVLQAEALLRIRWAEQQARSLARDWHVAFDAITDAIVVLSHSGEVVRCNRAALHIIGAERDQVLGQDYRAVWHDEGGALPADLPALGTTMGPLSIEIRLGERWYRLAVDPIPDEVGAGGGDVVVVLTDISELKRYEHELRVQAEQLQRHNRRQTEFLGLLAHELRNPLAAIAGAVDLISTLGLPAASERAIRVDGEGEGAGTPDGADALSIVNRQVGNLTRMVSDILDISRMIAGKVALKPERVDLRACAIAAVAAAQPAARAARHTLSVHPGDVPLMATVDRTRIDQVLANLIDNAIKYTPEGGRIEVFAARSAADPNQVQLRVRDNGAGMPAQRLEESFGMFVQYERTIDRAQGGLGLGLTLVRQLVKLHGGRVRAHSDGPGLGAVFDVYLPAPTAAIDATPDPAARPSAGVSAPLVERGFEQRAEQGGEPGASSGDVGRRVLLVEDNEDLRRLLAWKLRRSGHQVREASSGREGLEHALEDAPDAIVLDMGLPELDGYALARALRRDARTRECLLIALTGYGSASDRSAAHDAGIDLHLVKPVQFDELLDRIARGRS